MIEVRDIKCTNKYGANRGVPGLNPDLRKMQEYTRV